MQLSLGVIHKMIGIKISRNTGLELVIHKVISMLFLKISILNMILDLGCKKCLALFGTWMERGQDDVNMMVLNGGNIEESQGYRKN